MCDDVFFLRSLKATVVVAAISTIGWQLVVSVGHELGVVAHRILVAIVVQTSGRLVLDILLVSFVAIYAIDRMVCSPHGDRDVDAERGPLDSVTC